MSITNYNKKHKVFLQALIQEGSMDQRKASDLVMALFDHGRVLPVINIINSELALLNMSIKRAQCEITGKLYFVLVSTVLDNITRFQDEFSVAQLALLRNIFSAIITSDNGSVQSTICLNLCSSLNVKLSKAEAEEFLDDVVERKWLTYKDGHYYMGVRSITELMPYFRATYEGRLNTCWLCKQIIFHGIKCLHCDKMTHLFCFQNFAKMCNPVKCPGCENEISSDELPVIEDSMEEA